MEARGRRTGDLNPLSGSRFSAWRQAGPLPQHCLSLLYTQGKAFPFLRRKESPGKLFAK